MVIGFGYGYHSSVCDFKLPHGDGNVDVRVAKVIGLNRAWPLSKLHKYVLWSGPIESCRRDVWLHLCNVWVVYIVAIGDM